MIIINNWERKRESDRVDVSVCVGVLINLFVYYFNFLYGLILVFFFFIGWSRFTFMYFECSISILITFLICKYDYCFFIPSRCMRCTDYGHSHICFCTVESFSYRVSRFVDLTFRQLVRSINQYIFNKIINQSHSLCFNSWLMLGSHKRTLLIGLTKL